MKRALRTHPTHLAIVAAAVVLWAAPAQRVFDPLRGSLPQDAPQPVFSSAAADPWNRLFYLLFTRPVGARLLADNQSVFSILSVIGKDQERALSPQRITRIESGDRAIDPLYPSFLWMGSSAYDMTPFGAWGILKEPRYSELVSVLGDVYRTAADRPPLARALMQADLWAAYDMLHASAPQGRRTRPEDRQRAERTDMLLDMLARTIRVLALTRPQIDALPDNLAVAQRSGIVPLLSISSDSWMEIRWFPERSHESAMHDRRAARVFIKPVRPPLDRAAFLNTFRDGQGSDLDALEAVALVIQSLLIAADGTVVASPLTYEVQIRRRGAAARMEVAQFELSRRKILDAPASDGFTVLDEEFPVYLPIAGNDLSFATQLRMDAEPVVVPLRARCTACHGADARTLMTFSKIPGEPRPEVTLLDAADRQQARTVAARKARREDFQSLVRRWARAASPR